MENRIGFIIGSHRNADGVIVTQVNVDALKSTATDYDQNLRETIDIYHLAVNEGVENITGNLQSIGAARIVTSEDFETED